MGFGEGFGFEVTGFGLVGFRVQGNGCRGFRFGVRDFMAIVKSLALHKTVTVLGQFMARRLGVRLARTRRFW